MLTMLLTSDDAIFLDTIAIDLQISKNTALSDIKRLKQALVKDDLAVQFGRKEGYRIYGDEWTKRTKLMQAIATIYRQYGEAVTTELLDRWQTYLAMTKKKLQSVEQYLGVKYTDEDFYSLIYFISAILVRIKHGQVINSAGFDDRDDIEQTREYQALFYNQDAFSDLPVQEKAYIALNLLSANTRDRSEINERLSARLSNALWEFLTEFEAKAFIVLPNKRIVSQTD
ncbi:PRD/PTS system IIA 2 domain-containing regulatory protein [Lacticaseibacillus rhamnosus MTCC 5462]|nr:PRD/PTS system IIA 2 domain-containing regulatory protein [Lacticaseibacillus rhamnosus MTCC 5462]